MNISLLCMICLLLLSFPMSRLQTKRNWFPTSFSKSWGLFRYIAIYLFKNTNKQTKTKPQTCYSENCMLQPCLLGSFMLRLLHAFSLMLFWLPCLELFSMPKQSFRRSIFVNLRTCHGISLSPCPKTKTPISPCCCWAAAFAFAKSPATSAGSRQ